MNRAPDHVETDDALIGFLARAEMAGRPVAMDEDLLTSGLLDSLKVMTLVAFVEDRIGSEIPLDEILPENFGTPGKILAYMDAHAGV